MVAAVVVVVAPVEVAATIDALAVVAPAVVAAVLDRQPVEAWIGVEVHGASPHRVVVAASLALGAAGVGALADAVAVRADLGSVAGLRWAPLETPVAVVVPAHDVAVVLAPSLRLGLTAVIASVAHALAIDAGLAGVAMEGGAPLEAPVGVADAHLKCLVRRVGASDDPQHVALVLAVQHAPATGAYLVGIADAAAFSAVVVVDDGVRTDAPARLEAGALWLPTVRCEQRQERHRSEHFRAHAEEHTTRRAGLGEPSTGGRERAASIRRDGAPVTRSDQDRSGTNRRPGSRRRR